MVHVYMFQWPAEKNYNPVDWINIRKWLDLPRHQ